MASSSESLRVKCPKCRSQIPLRDASLLGKKVKCPRCKEIFRAPEPFPEPDEFFDEAPEQDEEELLEQLPEKRRSKKSSGTKPSRKKSRNDPELQKKLLWLIPIGIGILMVGAGLSFIPFGKMTQVVNRFIPLSDSYNSLNLELQEVRSNYEDLQARLIDRGPIKEEEIRAAAEACARSYESIRKRALKIRSRSNEEFEVTRKDLENHFARIQERGNRLKVIFSFAARDISRIEDNLGRYSPRVQYLKAQEALSSIPDPPSQENSIYRALSDMYQLEYDSVLEMFRISSTDQIDSVLKVVQEKSRRVSEISDQIEKEAKSDPQLFAKQTFQFSSTPHTRLMNLEEILRASDRSNQDLELAVAEFDRQRTRLFETVKDQRWKAGRIALGLEPNERPPDLKLPAGLGDSPLEQNLKPLPRFPPEFDQDLKKPHLIFNRRPPANLQGGIPPGLMPEQKPRPVEKQPEPQPKAEENPFKVESSDQKPEVEESPFKIEK